MGTPRIIRSRDGSERPRPIIYWHYDVNAVIAASLCAMLVGVMLAVPLKVKENTEKLQLRNFSPPSTDNLSRQEIVTQYQELEIKYKDLQTELAQERTRKQSLEESLSEKEKVAGDIVDDLQRTRLIAGLVPAEGPGLVLKITEDLEGAKDSEDVGLRMIHQEDLLNIVNELFSAGAEAMAIRSSTGTERIVTTSAIRCVGPTVIVNSTRMAPPFEILAIGDAHSMRTSLEIPNGVLAVLSIYRIKTELRDSKKLVLPAYSGKSSPSYAIIHKESVEEAGSAAAGSSQQGGRK